MPAARKRIARNRIVKCHRDDGAITFIALTKTLLLRSTRRVHILVRKVASVLCSTSLPLPDRPKDLRLSLLHLKHENDWEQCSTIFHTQLRPEQAASIPLTYPRAIRVRE